MEIPCILTSKSSSHKKCDKAVKLLNITLLQSKDDSDNADHDSVGDLSNTIPSMTIHSDLEVPPEHS